MKAYLDLVRKVLEHGTEKLPERKLEGGRKLDNSTIGLPNQIFSHDMADGFPLLTTKKIPLNIVAVELEGFIKGITSKAWYKQRKCNIWNAWANPLKVQKTIDDIKYFTPTPGVSSANEIDKKQVQLQEDDLGCIYGRQWRHYDQYYGDSSELNINIGGGPNGENVYTTHKLNGLPLGSDQLKGILNTLTDYPSDRRMVCLAWNPNQLEMQALPACHLGWTVTVYNNKLNLCWFQRSCDLPIGIPWNIASYALLLKLLAKHAKLDAGNLTGVLVDCHIYQNQIEAMKEQITREPRQLPTVEILDQNGEAWDFWKWDHTQLKVVDYNPHPPLKMEVTV